MTIKNSIKNTFNKVKDKVVNAIIEKEDDLSGVDDIALIFSTIESHNVNLQSTITDYWLEDQTAVNDSIGLQPIQIQLSGLVGEIEYTDGSSWGDTLVGKINQLSKEKLGFTLTDKLGAIGSLMPKVDNYTQIAKNALKTVENVYKNIKSKINKFLGNNTELKQTQRAEWLMKVWQTKTALKVTTPFGQFHNMYILSAPIVQDQTNTVSKISVTLKQLRFASDLKIEDSEEEGSSAIRDAINEEVASETSENGQMKTEELPDDYFDNGFSWADEAKEVELTDLDIGESFDWGDEPKPVSLEGYDL